MLVLLVRLVLVLVLVVTSTMTSTTTCTEGTAVVVGVDEPANMSRRGQPEASTARIRSEGSRLTLVAVMEASHRAARPGDSEAWHPRRFVGTQRRLAAASYVPATLNSPISQTRSFFSLLVREVGV